MKRLAAKKGLTGSAEAMVQELESLKLHVIMHEAAQDRLHAAPLAIEGGEVVADHVEDDGGVVDNNVGGEEEGEVITYDDDVFY
jgi:hypothetical protein